MKHFWSSLHGWFNFPEFYSAMADFLPGDGFRFVEVGVWKVQSLAFLGVELVNRFKYGTIWAVDTFEGSAEHRTGGTAYDPITDIPNGLYDLFVKHMKPFKETSIAVQPFPMKSLEAAKGFENQWLDAVFIDGEHDAKSVTADCEAWWPKLSTGGWLCGHDYDWLAVREAVNLFARNNRLQLMSVGPCWLIVKP